MDGQRVKEWEARCIEEQPPACTTACPLRVDVRGMLEKAKTGDFAGACALYARVIPFPAILSRICDHPCEAACRRAEAGGAIRIAALEKACVENAYASIRRAPQTSRKPKRVAIAGAGLAGLTAAFDLAMKGHAVTVFEAGARPLERLYRDYGAVLPPSAIDADIAALTKLGVTIHCGTRVTGNGPSGLDTLIAGYDAVLLALGPSPAPEFASTLGRTPAGHIEIDPATRVTSHPKVFGGGVHGGPGVSYSPISSAHDGRRAAASIDRLLQGASLTAIRADEADRLLPVRKHRRACARLSRRARRGGSRLQPIRGDGRSRALLPMPLHGMRQGVRVSQALRLVPQALRPRHLQQHQHRLGEPQDQPQIDSCALCGLCETICPNDLSMGEVCLEARRNMVETGHMPASHHEFALRDMAHSRSDAAAFARHEPGRTASAMAFFPGCQLSASSPWHVERIYAHLRAKIPGGVGLMIDCCGAPAHWSGRREPA